MKKLTLIITVLCTVTFATAQNINSTIPDFAISLFGKSRATVEQNLKNAGFRIFSEEDKRTFNYTAEEAQNTTVALGDYMINCKIKWPYGENRHSISVNGVQYTSYRGMAKEYIDTGWNVLEEGRTHLVYKKEIGNFIYLAQVDYMLGSGMCMANATFERVAKK